MHCLITGATGTGKSTLLRSLISDRIAQGRDSIIYDPVGKIENSFHDDAAFMEKVAKCENVSIFVDEADTLLSLAQRENNWILTRGRHRGFEVFISTQRPQLVNPTARGQCEMFFCFRLSMTGVKLIQDDFAVKLPDCQNLPKGTCYHGRYNGEFYEASKIRIF
jgi:DNA helicase HerA-like ATPase